MPKFLQGELLEGAKRKEGRNGITYTTEEVRLAILPMKERKAIVRIFELGSCLYEYNSVACYQCNTLREFHFFTYSLVESRNSRSNKAGGLSASLLITSCG